MERLTSPTVLRRLLEAQGLRLRPALGQHFLADAHVLARLLEAIAPEPRERAVEVGAGIGTLTVALAPRVAELWAVEVDPRLLPLLRAHLAPFPHVHILHADFRDLALAALGRDLLLVGNLPYGITSDVLVKLIRERESVARAVFTVQWEVGEKLVAAPGPQASRLGVHLRAYFSVELVRRIPRTAFFPPPEVDGAVIRLQRLPAPRITLPEPLWERTLALAFAHRRKSLRRVLASHLSPDRADALLAELGLDPRVRAEALDLPELERLGWALARLGLLGEAR
ncbi:MAG: 16S rRNA (adenine(1518)-N(6)/adenine(1519)-N(6))-dimethyltransferase RsmA [Candidatus Bipolaricaulaceae bacterium]